MQAMTKPWQDQMGRVAAQNKLVRLGNRLACDGKVIKLNKLVTNGTYVEIKEAIGAHIITKSNSFDEAAETYPLHPSVVQTEPCSTIGCELPPDTDSEIGKKTV
jgi:hypothetical protein